MKVGLVSSFPEENSRHDKGKSGASTYSKSLVKNLAPKVEELTIFADSEEYRKQNYSVVNSWKKGLLFPLSIFLSICTDDKDFDVIHIQHEVFLYGNMISTIIFPLLPLLLRLSRKKVVITLHNGLIGPSELDKDFCKRNNLIKQPKLLGAGLKLYFNILSIIASKLIVHEERFRTTLAEYGLNTEKIDTIHHGVEDIGEEEIEEKNEENIILFFGYVAPYKGVETLLDIEEDIAHPHKTIIAGGKHPGAEGNNYYSTYYREMMEKSSKLENVITTGFVEEEKVKEHFKKSDVVVLPYKDVFSSSGPLHHALSYEKPILASQKFEDILPSELTYSSKKELTEKINETFKQERTANYKTSKQLKSERKWEKVSKKHIQSYSSDI